MTRSAAATVEEYLEELPEDRRRVVSSVREVILENLPDGYEEAMNRGMITYQVPLERYPDTYNGEPLAYLSLAAQKNHYALYLMGVYMDEERAARLAERFRESGKELDMGKSCLRFRRLDDLPVDVVGEEVSAMSPADFIARYEAVRRR